MSDSGSPFQLVICSGWLLMVGVFIWGIIDLHFLLDYVGEIKRGIKIWSEPLSPARRVFLTSLTRDIVEERSLPFRPKVVGFIKLQGSRVLIQRRRAGWRTSWPCVGYVDLRKANPVIEYRSSLPMHLLLLPFVLTIVAIPVIGLILGVNYWMERGAILDFIDEQMKQSE